MPVHTLGHVVLKVRDLERSEAFYSGTLGMPIISRLSDPVRMTFFTLGNHHDFAVMELGEHATTPAPAATGLAHVAFKVGDSPDELRTIKAELVEAGVPILYEAERLFTSSVHLLDPDQNEIELYIDTSQTWEADASPSRPADTRDRVRTPPPPQQPR